MKLTQINNPTALRLDTTVGTRIFAGTTMIYGDTGWRRVNELFPEFDLTVSGAGAYFRRVGSDITIMVSGVFLEPRPNEFHAFGPSLNTISATPQVGYQASVGTWSTGVQIVSQQTVYNLTCGGYNNFLQAPGIEKASYWVNVVARYATRSAWPTTLPGIPA